MRSWSLPVLLAAVYALFFGIAYLRLSRQADVAGANAEQAGEDAPSLLSRLSPTSRAAHQRRRAALDPSYAARGARMGFALFGILAVASIVLYLA